MLLHAMTIPSFALKKCKVKMCMNNERISIYTALIPESFEICHSQQYGVGGITVCYGACLWSPVPWVRACHPDYIIFGLPFYIQNSAKILVELEFWIFKSDPNLVVDIS